MTDPVWQGFQRRTSHVIAPGLLDDLDDAHHRMILVKQEMAVVDKLPGVVEKPAPDRDLAVRRDHEGIVVAMCGARFPVDGNHLEIVDMDMKRMPFMTDIDQLPFLQRV